jgi:hypothetical protein
MYCCPPLLVAHVVSHLVEAASHIHIYFAFSQMRTLELEQVKAVFVPTAGSQDSAPRPNPTSTRGASDGNGATCCIGNKLQRSCAAGFRFVTQMKV